MPQHPAERQTEPSSALATPGFATLWSGQALSQLGWQFTGLAVPVIAVNLLDATDSQMGYLNASSTIAFLAIGLLAGGLVDRWHKRRVMVAADLVRAAVVAAVPALFWLGSPELWHLYIVAGILGLASVFFDVAYQSYVPVLLPSSAIGDANGKLEATAQVARLAGPGLAGLLLRVVSAPMLLVVNSFGFLASAGFLATIRESERPAPRADRDPLLTEIADGIHFVWREPLLQRIVAVTALSNLGSTVVFTLEPLLVLRLLDVSPWWYGMISSLGAIGGVGGSLLATRAGARFGEGPALVAAAALSGISAMLLPLAAVMPSATVIPLLVAASMCMAAGVIVYNVIQVTARQRLCPPALLGRMNASIRFVVWGVMPLAALLAGWLGSALGTVSGMWVGAAVMAAGALPLALSPFARMRHLPTSPRGGVVGPDDT